MNQSSMEERFRYDCSGKWFKGNLHMHTTRSDGRLTLAEASALYAERGYDFISITDHRVPFVGAEESEQLPIMILDGIELDGRDDQGSGYHVVCIGGGIGTAPLYPITAALHQKGNRVTVILGARSQDLIILEKEMDAVSDRLLVTTDDGSRGQKGFVTDVLRDVLNKGGVDMVFSIGPLPMMKVIADVTRPHGIKTVVSLDSIMIDGTGMCGGCRVRVGGKTRFTCVDGPEFDAHEIDWDIIRDRKRIYVEEEKISKEHFEKSCRCSGN